VVPNGSGKSNFFDALDFVRLFVCGDIEIALRAHAQLLCNMGLHHIDPIGAKTPDQSASDPIQ